MRHEIASSCNRAQPQAHEILRQVYFYLLCHGTLDDVRLITPLRIDAYEAAGMTKAAEFWRIQLAEDSLMGAF